MTASAAPIPARLTRVQRDGLTFDVIDSGPADGTPVLLLHGFPQRASSWEGVSAHLHQAGLRTYALDQRGYSPGARPRSRFAYRATELRADAAAVIERIGRPVHVVGHDWGAAVAWGLAAAHPEHVASLTAVSVPHPGAFLRSMLSSTQALKSWYMALFQVPWLPEALLSHPTRLRDRYLAYGGLTPEMIATFQREVVEDGALRGGLGYYRSLPLAPPGELGRRVPVPVTYVWSDGDVALGRKGTQLCPRYVTGPYRFVEMSGVSHWIPDEEPAWLAKVIVEQVEAASPS